jgi:hypothetical protein
VIYTIKCHACEDFVVQSVALDDVAAEASKHRQERHPNVSPTTDPVYCEPETEDLV